MSELFLFCADDDIFVLLSVFDPYGFTSMFFERGVSVYLMSGLRLSESPTALPVRSKVDQCSAIYVVWLRS